jgi:hypothetical protein
MQAAANIFCPCPGNFLTQICTKGQIRSRAGIQGVVSSRTHWSRMFKTTRQAMLKQHDTEPLCAIALVSLRGDPCPVERIGNKRW